MDFVKYFKEKAKSDIQRIVLAEGTEERTLKAADIVLGEGFADLIILSKPESSNPGIRLADKHALFVVSRNTSTLSRSIMP